MENLLRRLGLLLERFPGIGPRQAARFVYFLVTSSSVFRKELAQAIIEIDQGIQKCADCGWHFPLPLAARSKSSVSLGTCRICQDQDRDHRVLMVVEKDIDLESVEKLGVYRGRYFILGGLVSILEKAPGKKIRQRALWDKLSQVTGSRGITEVILALAVTPEGDHTAEHLTRLLKPLSEKQKFSITVLGRGLSTGTELEYSDADTLRHALSNRH